MDRLLKPGKLEVSEKADDLNSVNKLGLLTNYLTHKTLSIRR